MRRVNGGSFAVFVLGELALLWSCRTDLFFLKAPRNITYYVWMLVVAAIFLMLIYLPGLSKGIGVAPMDGIAWVHAFVVAAGMLFFSEVFKFVYLRRLRRQHELHKSQNIYMNPVGYNVPECLSSGRKGKD
jgi:magnesium-transporting ATPase (P-type)